MSMSDIIEQLKRRVEVAYPSKEEAIERLSTKKNLKIYFGIDPTGIDIHLGHTIQLLFLNFLSQLGHKPILLIGDFTARIGDPTGKDKSRKALTEEEIKENMKTYLSQIHKVLPEGSYELKYNSQWLKGMTLENILGLASHATVQQMIVRDMFQERLKQEKPIYVSEFLYPLMQGYDSVAMEVDGEIGGNDQIFNMLMGRTLEKEYLSKDKLVFATRLLIDSKTGKKMSKSEGNLIALNDSPQEIRRKILDVDDKFVKTLFELCTKKDQSWIDEHAQDEPRGFKEELAKELIRMYHGESAVGSAKDSTEIESSGSLLQTLISAGIVKSASEGKKLVTQKGVKINNEVISEWDKEVKVGDELQVGKGKFFKIK